MENMEHSDRRDYLVSFLLGCAGAADDGQLMINGDLVREAAEEFEKLIPREEAFKDPTDELHFNLIRAEQHARQAHDLLYKKEGPKRSIWFKGLLGRAQSILMSLYVQELKRTGRRPKQ